MLTPVMLAQFEREHRSSAEGMVKVTVGKAEDPWCEIELTEEDVEDREDAWKVCKGPRGLEHIGDRKDWKKGVDITEEKLKEVH